jgi:spermidine synthase
MAVTARASVAALLPLFLVSMATVGFETTLTRYFAVAKWSEYGYWVISIVLAGFALSGVVMALARDWFARHGTLLLAWLPVALILAAAAGYHLVTTNPFNPLQLQNPTTYGPQLANIAGYYVCLLPFFFLSGLFVSLSFVLNDREIGRVYGYDLTGAGIGALLVLVLMFGLHPFSLMACLLAPLGLAALFARRARVAVALAAVLALGTGEALLLLDDQAAFNDFKAIYAPLHVPDSRTVAEIRSPRGLYMLLDDFTERVDTDVSNNSGLLGVPGPPTTLGLYRDGNRVAALPKPGGAQARYALATLAALPYLLRPRPRVLIAGASGGFRLAEALALGAAAVDVVEPDPVLRMALRQGLGPSPAFVPRPGVRVLAESPVALAESGARYDVVDLSADFLDEAEANANAFTSEAIAAYLKALTPGGIVSIPVSIREFPAYAIRMLATARAGLLAAGVAAPGQHVLVYRSAWNVRILLSDIPFDAAWIAAAKQFCDERSFDISYYAGMDVVAARATLYNDLPDVSFEEGEVTSGGGAHDAIADEAGPVLDGEPTVSSQAFNLSPITFDRPSFYAVLRLARLGTIIKRLEILPQAEIGPLVNLAVLAQAVVIALLVLAVPLVGRVRPERSGLLRPVVYFSALGLGFLFIEIFLIERASFYLNDRTSGFALVLTGMLIFSGLGSMAARRFEADPARGVRLAVTVIVLWCATVLAGLQWFMLATLSLPWLARAGILLLLVAPVSLALGLPFPLGLSRAGHGGFLPWAWGLNGAFSVVSTPLANLIAVQQGFDGVLFLALMLYAVTAVTFPRPRKSFHWQDISAT